MKRKKRVSGTRRVRSIRAEEGGKAKCSTLSEERFGPDGEVLDGGSGSRFREWIQVKGALKQPGRRRVSLYLDADVLAFFRDQGPRYQRLINKALRAVMEKEARSSGH